MAFSAADVKNLREMTGVGMMDCKKALTAADGDIDKAVEWLREKGLAAAQKKAGRIAAEGMAYAVDIDGIGVIIEVNAESDFVAKNDLFVEYVKGVAAVIAKENPADLDALYACVGMMDCKKALTAADGDIDKAVEWLREKGLAAAQKKAGRIAAEGMAYAVDIDGIGVIIEVNAESDFVAKNDLFVEYVKGVAAVIAKENPADLDALYACAYGNGKTVLEEQNDKVLVIGENIKVRRFARYDTGLSVPYVHMGGRIAVLVNLETESTDAAVIELGKDIAMQIAALNPTYMDKSDVSEEFIAKEKEIRLAQAKEDPKNAKKPDAIIEKIVMGGIGKYFKEICLLQQPFVKDDKVSVEDHIAAVAKQIGASIKLVGYTRFEKGEGIEKRQDDLAEEVAKLVK